MQIAQLLKIKLMQMTLKIIAYIFYVIVFTYCYYFLNRKFITKWILILYPQTHLRKALF